MGWVDEKDYDQKWQEYMDYFDKGKLFKYKKVYFYPELKDKAIEIEGVYRNCVQEAVSQYDKDECMLSYLMRLISLFRQQLEINKELLSGVPRLVSSHDILKVNIKSDDVQISVNPSAYKQLVKNTKLLNKLLILFITRLKNLYHKISKNSFSSI